MFFLLSLLPRNVISRLTGWLADRERPAILVRLVIRRFVDTYGVDTSELARSLDSFRSLGEFFVRELVPSARPIGDGLVSPVDGTLRDIQRVCDGKLMQVKGIEYSLGELLGDSCEAQSFEGAWALNFYLSPRDYHAVHAPCDGMLCQSRVIPGTLWPVNDLSFQRVPALFAKNERIVIHLETEFGAIAVVMVGAFNVGKMTLAFDEVVTNSGRELLQRDYRDAGKGIEKGQRMGTFHLGSSVLVIVPEAVGRGLAEGPVGREVKFGESLVMESRLSC